MLLLAGCLSNNPVENNLPSKTTEKKTSNTVPVTDTQKSTPPVQTAQLTYEEGNVTGVADGDTIKVSVSGVIHTVRYIGVDTPETKHPTIAVECFGPEADAFNRKTVLGKIVRMEKDVSDTDTYGRLLRYVYVENQMVNEVLVREGYATATTYPPDVKYQTRFEKAEDAAQTEEKGLWNACT